MGGIGGKNSAVLQGIKLGVGVNDFVKSREDNKRQLSAIRQQQEINRNRQKNILEEQLASRRARLGSMGISASGSATASQNKLIEDAYNNIAEDDNAYNEKYSQYYSDYQSNLRKKIIDGALEGADKVLK